MIFTTRYGIRQCALILGCVCVLLSRNALAVGCGSLVEPPCDESFFLKCQSVFQRAFIYYSTIVPDFERTNGSAVEATCGCDSLRDRRDQELRCRNVPSSVKLMETFGQQIDSKQSVPCDHIVLSRC